MTGASLRWLRAPTLAFVLLTCSLGGHASAGGATPPSGLLVPLFLLTTVAVAPFVGVPLGPWRVTGVLLVGQGVLHLLLELAGGTPEAVSGAAAVHAHHAPPPEQYAAAPSAHLAMVAAHVLAAVVVGLWLSAGERAVATLLALAARPWVDAWRALVALAASAAGALVVRPVPAPVRQERSSYPRADWPGRHVSRRGPPAACC